MPDKTNNNGYDVPSIDETASSQSTPSEGQKSPISMITEEVKASGLQIKPTIENFRMLIAKHYSDHLRLNEMTGKPEYRWKGIWYEWTDTQESKMKAYFQNNYNVYSTKMLEDAIRIHFDYNKVNPLLNIIEKLEWDGKPRVEHFLHDIMKAEDNEYTRECSRLIFAGGIHRALRPGCKFDDMIVLIGGQGAGKSTIVRWLNIDDQFYQEIKTITGKEGIEALRGVWIGEVSELMAMTRAKEVEAVKAYVTSQKDNYRPPYEKNVRTIPRRCIFIGTTNNPQWLSYCQQFVGKLADDLHIVGNIILCVFCVRIAQQIAVSLDLVGNLQQLVLIDSDLHIIESSPSCCNIRRIQTVLIFVASL